MRFVAELHDDPSSTAPATVAADHRARGRDEFDLWSALAVRTVRRARKDPCLSACTHDAPLDIPHYRDLITQPATARWTALVGLLRRAGVRWARWRASRLAALLDHLAHLGGPERAWQHVQRHEGLLPRLQFLADFPRIDREDARAILVCGDDPALRRSMVVDHCVTRVSRALGLTFDLSQEIAHEDFYCGVADDAGIELRTLERLLHEQADRVIAAVSPETRG